MDDIVCTQEKPLGSGNTQSLDCCDVDDEFEVRRVKLWVVCYFAGLDKRPAER